MYTYVSQRRFLENWMISNLKRITAAFVATKIQNHPDKAVEKGKWRGQAGVIYKRADKAKAEKKGPQQAWTRPGQGSEGRVDGAARLSWPTLFPSTGPQQ